MSKVTVIIPTCSSSRLPFLFRATESITNGSYEDLHIVIVADGNSHIYKTAGEFFENKKLDNVAIILNKKRMDWVFSINRILKEFDSEYYIYASDDLEFPKDCIKMAVEIMDSRFPDGFGVVGIARKQRLAFGLIGRKFVDHFPNREVFCPDFIHYYSDSELYRTVIKLGNFAYLAKTTPRVLHRRLRDETWRLARKVRRRDNVVDIMRQEKGYKWGIDFNLVMGQ